MSREKIVRSLRNAMSSEHCSYASTRKYLKTLPAEGKYVIQGPGENAGILDLGSDLALALRIESHNHPSQITPYDGAATGVGGILRDIFTMGAKPIALLDFLRFGTNQKGKALLKDVVLGISDYGNCVGVPVVGGDTFFDETYNKNCLVNICALGLVKKENVIYGHALTPGNDLIYVGAKTGRDGIHGAEMASENLKSKQDSSTVQKPDAFLEKLLLDACCELAEKHYIEGMQDMGAAGLLCSTTEIALRGQKRSGRKIGTLVYLDKVPLKSKDMSPVEILLSESQERMMIVGKRKFRNEILEIFKKWDLESEVIGIVTEDGKYTISTGEEFYKISFDEIFPNSDSLWMHVPWIPQRTEYEKADSKTIRKIWHQYDWMVGTRTIKGPNKPGNFAILDLDEIGKEIVVSWSSDEGKSDTNPKEGVKYAFKKCYKRIQEQKAIPLGLTNCLNFGHPKDSMGAFEQTILGLKECCEKKEVPVVSGNVSLYNSYSRHSIKPTPILVMVGIRSKN